MLQHGPPSWAVWPRESRLFLQNEVSRGVSSHFGGILQSGIESRKGSTTLQHGAEQGLMVAAPQRGILRPPSRYPPAPTTLRSASHSRAAPQPSALSVRVLCAPSKRWMVSPLMLSLSFREASSLSPCYWCSSGESCQAIR